MLSTNVLRLSKVTLPIFAYMNFKKLGIQEATIVPETTSVPNNSSLNINVLNNRSRNISVPGAVDYGGFYGECVSVRVWPMG